MNNITAVYGFTGGIKFVNTEVRFRPYSFGTVNQPPSEPTETHIIAATTKIAQRLTAAGTSVSVCGIIGDDAIADGITAAFTHDQIDMAYVQKVAQSPSEQLLIITDKKGFSFAYRFNPFVDQSLETALSNINTVPANTSTAVVTSLNSDIMQHAFELLGDKQIPIVWNAYMCYNNVTPIQLLSNMRQSQIVIFSDYEASYLKQSLGFTGIDQMVSEGPSDILILHYTTDGRIAIDHYDKDRHTVSYNTAQGGMPPSILMDSIDEFSIGMTDKMHNEMSVTEVIEMCMERTCALSSSTS